MKDIKKYDSYCFVLKEKEKKQLINLNPYNNKIEQINY